MFSLLHRRSDGSFVILRNNKPYHVIKEDILFEAVATAAEGVVLPAEPLPPSVPVRPSPTKAELMQRLDQIAAQIAALDTEAP